MVLKRLRTVDIGMFPIILCFFLSIFSVFSRAVKFFPFSLDNMSVWVAKPVFFRGDITNYYSDKVGLSGITNNKFSLNGTSKVSNPEYSVDDIPNPPSSSNIKNDDSHHVGEKTYKITETQIKSGGAKYDNFYVKNISGTEINILKQLSAPADIRIKNTKDIQVLIYHTHTSESYLQKDEGFFYESYYPRSTDNSINVTRVGEAITNKLLEHGIGTLHDTTYHDSPTYKGAYSRSYKTIKENLQKHPSIKVTIDVHRDSMGDKESGKVKPTFKIKGNKAAQIMVITGCDKDGSIGFPDWEQNLRFALKVQKKCETMFPGLTRPMFLGKVRYNLNLTHGSILVEVGSDVNTLDEAIYSGTLFGEALAHVLKELK